MTLVLVRSPRSDIPYCNINILLLHFSTLSVQNIHLYMIATIYMHQQNFHHNRRTNRHSLHIKTLIKMRKERLDDIVVFKCTMI